MVQDWSNIPIEDRNRMLRNAGMVDDKGRPKQQLTRKIKMMLTDQYYGGSKKSNVITK